MLSIPVNDYSNRHQRHIYLNTFLKKRPVLDSVESVFPKRLKVMIAHIFCHGVCFRLVFVALTLFQNIFCFRIYLNSNLDRLISSLTGSTIITPHDIAHYCYPVRMFDCVIPSRHSCVTFPACIVTRTYSICTRCNQGSVNRRSHQ